MSRSSHARCDETRPEEARRAELWPPPTGFIDFPRNEIATQLAWINKFETFGYSRLSTQTLPGVQRSTVSIAAAPASSRVLSAPIQKCTFISVEPLLSHVWSTM